MDYMDVLVKSTAFNNNVPLIETVYRSLREAIINGIIPLGERIREKEYAERLNISRTPIRTALRMLEEDQLIENIPRVGMIVKSVSIEDVKEVFKIRHNLEVLATTLAMNNITKEEIEELEKLLDLTELENQRGNVKGVIDLIGDFNVKIYKASRMKRLRGMISELKEYLKRFRNISMADSKRRELAIKEHRQILQAIVEKDKEKIDTVIRKHLEYSLDVVIEEIKGLRKQISSEVR